MSTNSENSDIQGELVDSNDNEDTVVSEEHHLMALLSQVASSPDFSDKITSEHITEYLEGAKTSMEYNHKDKNYEKIFLGFIAVLVFSLIITLVVLLNEKPNLLEKLLYSCGGLLTGLAGGYGWGRGRKE